ncbi:uncharacterized protein TRUGW13939_06491 [Talaromyces rugulosus]|uniref:RED-like N-terminal domain-containing protein n=1 Tax=Talaromyces rugulosus TaxID=121627 RepID=A0A7H8QZE5_TALRU|nr:uncharacterized protein TRUGW13939_06491 [Talaromyces rugulosus]QKX59357.1 hypothetical protein TRUGW13939_06491 [Talaromyces rugulosus]
MNNDQFRRLVLDKPGKRADANNDSKSSEPNAASTQNATTPSTLGSRMRSGIPMTPRNVRKGGGVDFARQLAEQRRESGGGQQPPTKRFKSSAAPKGTRLASGYQDRTALRRQQDETDNNNGEEGGGGGGGGGEKEGLAQRLKALEDMVKLGQIDQATFDKLRKDLGVGGDLQSTHLVKGLDWDLLKRVKGGEDVSKEEEEEEKEKESEQQVTAEDVDDELDRVLEENADAPQPAPKEKRVKKGNLAAPPGKMSRDEILRQLKASRAAAAENSQATSAPVEPALGSKFKKIHDGKPEKKRWIETDPSTGRRKEILTITDAEGKTKRKVRWLDKELPPQPPTTDGNGLLLPDQKAAPLGMEVPAEVAAKIAAEAAAAAAQSEDEDIFAGVGTEYNPLADLDEADSSDEEDEEGELADDRKLRTKEEEKAPPVSEEAAKPRNYFGKTEEPAAEDRSNPLASDPTILAALKRAAALRQGSAQEEQDLAGDGDEDVDPEKLARRKKFLEEARRREAQDALDIDYGFGSSRVEDEEDEEGPTFDDQQRGGAGKRKRGPKKRKGDKDSAADVLRVMEGRK